MKIRPVIFFLFLCALNAKLNAQSYCIPTYTTGNVAGDYISNVTLASINNTSGKAPAPNFYSDFTSQQTTLVIGDAYTVNVTSGTYPIDSFFVWIDYNHDFDFLDTGEKIGKFRSTASSQTNTINFSVSATAITGTTRMRVRCIYNTAGNPCNTFTYGETEDYNIDIKRNLFKASDFVNFPDESDVLTYSRWLDYDRDNLYDLLSCGWYNSIYFKEPVNQFVHPNLKDITGTDLIITGSGWTDMNNDGSLEVLFNGYDSKSFNYNTELFIYSEGNFIKKTHTIAALSETKLDFKDFDNDGKYDLLISGKHSNFGNVSKVYKNTGLLNFTEIATQTTSNSTGAWIDIDNDSDFDAIVGNEIYKNENGVLSEYFHLADSGSVATGDINLDGFTDFIIGNTIYLNDSATFHVNQKIEIQSAKNTFGDYDNNGNLDLLHDNILYENRDATFIKTDYNFFGNNPYFVDYDYDGDLDIGFLNKIYNNQSVIKNSAPAAPQSVSAKYENGDIILSWTPSINDQTPSKSLTYNLFLSTVPGGNDIISSNSNPANGFRYIIEPGNAGQNFQWKIGNIPIGKYYFGVQAIDNNFAGSAFRTGDIEIKKFTFTTHNDLTGEGGTNYFFLEAFDADNDNTLDLAYSYTQSSISNHLGHIIINDQDKGPFYSISINNTVNLDYNQDGNIELLVSGNMSTFPAGETRTNPLYSLNKSLPAEISGPSACFDVDNDGDEDIINRGYIYEKQKIGQSDTIIKKPGLLAKNGAISYADFDLDMDHDLLIGDSLFRNDNGTFIFYQYLQNTETTSAWGDYNNDGYPDLIAGNKVYRNDAGNMVFTGTTLSTYPGTKVFWADFNNDGYLDIVFFDNNNIIQLFENSQGVQFSSMDMVYDQCYLKSITLSDADNDMDLDIEGIGYWQHRYRSEFTSTFTNQYANKNSVPDAPKMLKSKMTGLDILLSWKEATDDHTSSKGLSYNIIVGTKPWKQDIMPCYSDIITGFRKVVKPGNVQNNKSWILKNLPVGKYYWSAQAIDQAYFGGPWAPIDSFLVTRISPEFSFDTVCLGNSTHFINKTVSSDPIASYIWNFGDNTVSTVASPSHSYAYAGTFKVTLTAISTINDTVRISYDVPVKDKPITSFSANVACQGISTTFLNTTIIHGLNIISWRWDFGDGLFSMEKDPASHGYINSGDYPVKLKVTAQNGCADSVSQSVTVAAYPIAAVTANAPLTFCDGDSVTLSVPYNADYLYNWKSGGTSLTGADSNRFVARLSGSYSAEVINSKGNCSTTSSVVAIIVRNAPVAPYISSGESKLLCQGDSVLLSVTNTTGYSYQWKLNGGGVGVNSNQYAAKNSGKYTVVVSNSNGCSVSSTNEVPVVVNPLPVVGAISLDGKKKFCTGDSVTLSVPSSTGYFYSWKDADGPITGAEKNSLTAIRSGKYQLEVSNSYGCKVTTEAVTVEVGQTPLKPAIDPGNYTEGKCIGETPVRLSVDAPVTGYTYLWYRNGTPIKTAPFIEGFLEKGQYYVEAQTGECTKVSGSVNVGSEDAPPKPIINAKGPTVWYLISSITNAAMYKWYYNGKLIPGAEEYLYIADQKLGKYNVSISNDKSCFTISDTITIPSGITGIEDTDPFTGLKIYPNPTTGLFTIEMDNNIFGELIIDIFTQNGSKTLNIKFDKTTEHFSSQINLSGQSKGMYLINLSIDKFKATKKILVE
jgi:PKD repeat protein